MRDPDDATTARVDLAGAASGGSRPAEDRVGELAEEFLERHRRGERPPVEEYARAHPELAGEIRRLFPALLVMEDLRPAASDLAGDIAACGTAPERLGDYRILREVGRGGMGVVYEAEQESLGRRVALKVLAAHGLRNPKQLLRFRREARAAARLHHTNIVPVFGVGESAGQHYYVMQFIPGLGLDAVLEEIKLLRGHCPKDGGSARPVGGGGPSAAGVARSLMTGQFAAAPPQEDLEERPAPSRATPTAVPSSPPSVVLPGQSGRSSAPDSAGRYTRSVALVGVQVAEALDYAHRQGILHRDIKPSNLLLDGQGMVWVADFGLAKAADSDDLTHTGDIVGTVRYMAPERFEGRCDARSDVYALGLTLYELLALRPAFDRSDRAELIRQVTHEEPPRLRGLDPAIPRDLETVVRKAIEREPGRRYADAGALAADLRRYVEGRPIRARRVSPLEHAWRWCRRNPAWAALVATVLVLVGLAVAWWAEAIGRRGPARAAFEAALERAAEWSNQGRWAEAREVLGLAEGLLKDAGARGREGRLRQAQDDLELAARLERNAIERIDPFRGKSRYPAVAAAYAAAFRGAGLAAADEAADAEAVATSIRGSAIREPLVAALDDWAVVTADARLRARLLEIARRADPDPGWRDRVRDPAVRGDHPALERLAAEALGASGAEQPPQLLMTLAALLEEVEGDPAPLLRAVQRRRPGDFWLNYALGQALVTTRPADSVGFIRAALALRPRDIGVLNSLVWALEKAGELEEALATSRRAVELDSRVAAAHHNLGTALDALGRPVEAEAAYRRAVALDPKGGLAHFGLGNALLKLGRPVEAEAAYRKSIALDPKGTPAHHGLGNALGDLGRPVEAEAAYRESIALDPKGALAHYGLGNALLELGRPVEAEAAYRESIALDPKGALAHYGLGNALLELGRSVEAEAAYRKSIALDPKSSPAHHGLGNALLKLGRPVEAEAAYRKSIALDPKGAPARRGLEAVLAIAGRDQRRDESYRRAIAQLTESFPDDHDAWNHAASLWAQTGDRAGYRAHCRRMLDRFRQTTDPAIAERTAKACLILPLGGPEQEEACELADRAVAMARGHWVEPWAEGTRALASYRSGHFADAVAWADRCLSREPETWNREIPAHLVRAMAYSRLSRLPEARAALARASDLYRTKVATPGGRAEGGDWHDQVIGEALQREAEAYILDRDFPADPFAR
jgi:serine/threonine protein kinase/tetratricopeptide (TPR) repeat protein